MSNRQGKCPGCGLVNPPDASECRCCGFVLRAGAQARTPSNAYAKPPHKEQSRGGLPFGWLIAFVLLAMGLSGLWHSTRENAAREARFAEAAEKSKDDEKPRKRSGPPSLSDRRGGNDARRRIERTGDLIRMGAERKEEFNRVIDEHERGVYGDKDSRQSRESQRGLSAPSQNRQPVFLEAQPPRELSDDR